MTKSVPKVTVPALQAMKRERQRLMQNRSDPHGPSGLALTENSAAIAAFESAIETVKEYEEAKNSE